MIVDGRAIAEDIYTELAKRRAAFSRTPVLGIVVSGDDPVIESFVRIKAKAAARLNITIERIDLSRDASTEQAIDAVHAIAKKSDGIIVQLPLADTVDIKAVLSEIPHEKDVDAINPLLPSESPIESPVALAVIEVLSRGGIKILGSKATVVGAGRLVGEPSAKLLKKLGAHVTTVTLERGSLDDLKDADIVVCGAGTPGFIKPEHIKEGVALIDAGTSEQGGVIKGDADPACAEKASLFTPVPGGIGPIAVSMIFKNVLDLAEKSTNPVE